MIFNNIEFFNIDNIEKAPDGFGFCLKRFPEKVIASLEKEGNQKGQLKAANLTGAEIRFYSANKINKLFLSATSEDSEIVIYRGDFYHQTIKIEKNIITPIILETPERFGLVAEEKRNNNCYSDKIWRIILKNNGVRFHFIEDHNNSIRPPKKEELPAKTIVFYGSSITNGAASTNYNNSFVFQVGQLLNCQTLNLGMSGTCYLEKNMADYIASLSADLFVLELGINMRTFFTVDEFILRSTYLINKLIKKGKPIVLITITPNYATYCQEKNIAKEKEEEFNKIIENLYEKYKNNQVFLVSGQKLLPHFTDLTSDLLHPSNIGHAKIAFNLSAYIKKYVLKSD